MYLTSSKKKDMIIIEKGDIENMQFEYAIKKPIPIRCIIIDDDFEVNTMEGTLRGKKGDYLMIGIEGEMYPCSKSIFDKTYHLIKILNKETDE